MRVVGIDLGGTAMKGGVVGPGGAVERAAPRPTGRDDVLAGLAAFAGELAASYAPELRVLGVAAEAPISTDTELFFRTVGSVSAANNLIATRVEAFYAAYPEFDPATVLTPDAVAQAALVDEKCGLPGPSTSPDLALAHTPLDTPALQAILHANSAGNRPAGAPLLVVQAAVDDGARLESYNAWSLMDNFEWAQGYSQRWGLVNVDFKTQERKLKASAHWYADVVSRRSIPLHG